MKKAILYFSLVFLNLTNNVFADWDNPSINSIPRYGLSYIEMISDGELYCNRGGTPDFEWGNKQTHLTRVGGSFLRLIYVYDQLAYKLIDDEYGIDIKVDFADVDEAWIAFREYEDRESIIYCVPYECARGICF